MFCPNCGAQNQDTATACAKCGFTLKAAAAAPKFKGTMLMMNAPPAGAVPRPAAAPPGGAAPPAAPPAAQPPAAAAPAAAAPAAARPKLKGTMIGVAPPSMGSHVGPQGAPQPPAPAAAPPQQYAPPPPAYEPPPPVQHASPSSAVNPLGGTVVADTSAFVAGPPTAQGGFPHPDAPPPPQNFPGGATQGFAAPPPQYGAPPQQQSYGSPPPGFGAPPPNFGGAPPAYGTPPQNFGAPPDVLGATAPAVDGGQYAQHSSSMAPVHDSLMPIPGVVGGTNPIVTVLLIVLTCGVYGIYLLVKGKKSAS